MKDLCPISSDLGRCCCAQAQTIGLWPGVPGLPANLRSRYQIIIKEKDHGDKTKSALHICPEKNKFN